jgi:L-lactate dehydrogenase complex protein LldG
VNARALILARIAESSVAPVIASPRNYRGIVGPGDPDLFAQRLHDYGARIHRLPQSDLVRQIQSSLAAKGVKNVVVPAGFPVDWLTDITAEVVRDQPPLSNAQLDALDGVVTTCSVAIAETGTIVLTHSLGQGRRALTLLPDYHLVVVLEHQIVFGVPDAVAQVDESTPSTWISGPSATSDIELKRVEGVHGPRHLEVLVVA